MAIRLIVVAVLTEVAWDSTAGTFTGTVSYAVNGGNQASRTLTVSLGNGAALIRGDDVHAYIRGTVRADAQSALGLTLPAENILVL